MRNVFVSMVLLFAVAGCRKDYARQDLDGDGITEADGDCGPGDPLTGPDAAEVCDGHDNNCDGTVDEGAGGQWFADGDGDGFGDDASAMTACLPPTGTVTLGGDCDDADTRLHPGATEACDAVTDLDCDGTAGGTDGDGDGAPECEDCDDANDDVFPGADETCDGTDEDCDGVVDNDPTNADTWYVDLDGDDEGSDRLTTTSCEAPDGFVADANDCDDLQAGVFPSAPEACDGLDNDCNGTIDDGASGTKTYWADVDNDGFGDPTVDADACVRPVGYVDNFEDCDDQNPLYNPSASESCTDPNDYNCDGSVGQADGDNDGTPACTDCDDGNPAVEPSAPEVCDGVDNDCNAQIDETAPTWNADVDGDGRGGKALSVAACVAPGGYVASDDDCDDLSAIAFPGAVEACNGRDDDCSGTPDADESDVDGDHWRGCEGDCDDTDDTSHPGAVELCDSADNDCDGTPDDAPLDAVAAWTDGDGDGYGTGASSLVCAVGAGLAGKSGDCNDAVITAFPGASETCNTADDDCDGAVDESGGTVTYYADFDGDGVGGSKISALACAAPVGYVVTNTDCDDSDVRSYPGATEACDGVDNNCDKASLAGEADADKDSWRVCAGDCGDSAPAVNPAAEELCNGVDDDCVNGVDVNAANAGSWYTDGDADGYGAGAGIVACAAPASSSALPGDCNDAVGSINPSAQELCNSKDDDCDKTVDDNPVDSVLWFTDADGDGYGTSASTKLACLQPANTSALGGDCDDGAKAISPGADELCATIGVDDDCDLTADEASARDTTIWFADTDGDKHGTPTNFTLACTLPVGRVALGDDCNDAKSTIYAGAPEVWYDGVDQDCNGKSDFDQDGDGYLAAKFGGNDCDDTSVLVTSCTLGQTQASAGRTCNVIHTAVPIAPTGAYWLDPDGDGNTSNAYQATCDMTTDGGGWTLVLNYNHLGGTNPALNVLTTRLPLLASTTLGVDESGSSSAWGHAGNALLATVPFTATRYYCKTSWHARVIDFKSTGPGLKTYLTTGTGTSADVYNASYSTNLPLRNNSTLPLHTNGENSLYANQGNFAMTEFPFYSDSGIGNPRAHWGIKGSGTRWECDDYPAGGGFGDSAFNTYHQVWVR